jgi:hypothetical protein
MSSHASSLALWTTQTDGFQRSGIKRGTGEREIVTRLDTQLETRLETRLETQFNQQKKKLREVGQLSGFLLVFEAPSAALVLT